MLSQSAHFWGGILFWDDSIKATGSALAHPGAGTCWLAGWVAIIWLLDHLGILRQQICEILISTHPVPEPPKGPPKSLGLEWGVMTTHAVKLLDPERWNPAHDLIGLLPLQQQAWLVADATHVIHEILFAERRLSAAIRTLIVS